MVVKYVNDFEIPEFYRSRTFAKVKKLMKFLKNFKILEIFRKKREEKKRVRAPALRVTRAETRLTVYRSLPIGAHKNFDLFIISGVFS